MCNEEELDEMVTTFKQLPESYQQSILDMVRDRKQLYDLHVTSLMQNESPMSSLDSVFNLLKQPKMVW
jgi:hypothetical protein